jgi:NADPH-dependent ferric siderophore reductase
VSSLPAITRVRHELKRRQLIVTRIERLAPKMLRIVLTGEELAQFTSLGFDDHVKLFFPSDEGPNAPAMRDFTPRRFDPQAGELWIELYLHEAGPAAAWAKQATVGQSLTVGGPRGSSILSPEGIDSHVLIGDETALPAIGRRLEELPANARALVLTESDGGATGYPLETQAALETVSIVREAHTEAPGKEIIDTLRKLKFPPGQCFTWVATESRAARAIRRYLTDERGFDKHWIKAAGYWQRGVTGKHEVISDSE